MKQQLYGLLAAASFFAAPSQAQTADEVGAPVTLSEDFDAVEMYLVDDSGPGKYIGTIEVRKTEYGVLFQPELSSLEPGRHGFHVHEDPSCEPNTKDAEHQQIPAGAAGDHFDPTGVDMHGGPYGVGHLGDLPMLYVNDEGLASHPVLAPRLKMEFLRGHSLIIHSGPDDYKDEPPDSGSRVACGIFFSEAVEGRVQTER